MPSRTPFFQIKMGDKTLPSRGEDISAWVSSVTVTEDDRQADNVSITIPDPKMIYADGLFEGSYIEADLGYAEPNQHALMIRAIVTKVELNYPDTGVPSLTLKGEDRSILMGLVEKKKVWKDRKVSDIVLEIAKQAGFDPAHVQIELNPDPVLRGKSITQDGKTDLAFLQELAQKYHSKCFVELDERGIEVLFFIPDRRIVRMNRPDEVVLRYRTGPNSNLLSFSPSFDSSYIDRQKEISDVDVKGKQVKSQERPQSKDILWALDSARLAQVSQSDGGKIKRLYDMGSSLKPDLQKKLAAKRPSVGKVVADRADIDDTNETLASCRLGMSASGTTFGNIWLRAKSNVTIEGVSARFEAKWYVSSVTHRIDSSGYKTDFKCVR